MMRTLILICLSFLSISHASAVKGLNGTWQGVMIPAGQPIEKGTILYADFEIQDGVLSGRMREEIYDSPYYAVKKINGTFVNKTLSFKQIVTEKEKSSSRIKWCRMQGSLTYDSITGYLSGSYDSYDCKRTSGKIILFRSDIEITKEEQLDISHLWFSQFVKDYNEGLYAPDIREIERKNFVFEPIYFDFDRAEIRPEYEAFLNRLIHVVKGHSDLRVKVIGHTDSDGTDQYNVELSRRRAEAIVDYFVKHGLSADRLEFDFKGESQPADTNNTPEGRQHNRRVDFQFI